MTVPPRSPSSSGSSSSSSHVRVVARIRPLVLAERANGSTPTVQKQAQHPTAAQNDAGSSEFVQASTCCGTRENRYFELDAVFDESSTQEEVYERSGAKAAVCQDIFNGFNCTILAYGQTSSGKTFTMGSAANSNTTTSSSSSSENPQAAAASMGTASAIDDTSGMIPRACHDLFEQIKEQCNGNAQVELSYLEIYNETLRDLLLSNSSSSRNQENVLRMRESPAGEVYVAGLASRKVQSPQEIGALMEEASARRTVACTAMNAVSSRSHAICMLRVKGLLMTAAAADDPNNNVDNNNNNNTTFASNLTLVDLAGSERIKKTGAEGNRKKEGININKSLFVLGQVVSALAEQDKKHAWKPPYRDSKLTRLLQDSLGGNSRTIMVACVSPADCNLDESVNTLRYAMAARNIKNTATRNVVQLITPEEAAKLQRENQMLKKQVEEMQRCMKEQIMQMQQQQVSVSPPPLATVPEVVVDEERELELLHQVEELQRSLELLSASEERLHRSIARKRKAEQQILVARFPANTIPWFEHWPLRLLQRIDKSVDLFHLLVAIIPFLLCVSPLLTIVRELLSHVSWSFSKGIQWTGGDL